MAAIVPTSSLGLRVNLAWFFGYLQAAGATAFVTAPSTKHDIENTALFVLDTINLNIETLVPTVYGLGIGTEVR